jgi:alanine racemase
MSAYAFRCWVEVSRRRIAENFQAIKAAVGSGVEVMPVVKADAYRHGAVEVSRVLVKEGARWLAVSSVEEGAQLRQAGITSRILVMADFLPVERAALIEYDLTPAVHSLSALRDWDRMSRDADQPLRYHLKIDTGMGRLGTQATPAEIVECVLAAKHARIEGLMTHFASAADYTSRQTDEQVQRFVEVRAALLTAGVQPPFTHMSSTIAIAYGRREAWGNLVRPGHGVYGYVSPPRGEAPESALHVQPALTWKASVLATKYISEGALVGYGGMFRAPKPMRIAILSAGYADGIPHRLSNKGKVIAAGKLAPMLGAVSMDVTTIDVTNCPSLQVGDSVTLLGCENGCVLDAQQIAKTAGTISYSILCGISARVRRVYL